MTANATYRLPEWMEPFRHVIKIDDGRSIEDALNVPPSLSPEDPRRIERQRVWAQLRLLGRMRELGLIAVTPRPGFDPVSGFEAQAVPAPTFRHHVPRPNIEPEEGALKQAH